MPKKTVARPPRRRIPFNDSWRFHRGDAPDADGALDYGKLRSFIIATGTELISAGVRDKPRRLYSYAEAIDGNGHVAIHGGRRLTWGGDALLCTRNVRFELGEHGDCPAAGLTAAGFATIDTVRQSPTTVRFTVPYELTSSTKLVVTAIERGKSPWPGRVVMTTT